MKTKEEGWEDDKGYKWFSEGYVEAKMIITSADVKKRLSNIIDGFDFSKRFSDAGYFGFGKTKLNEFMREELKRQIEEGK